VNNRKVSILILMLSLAGMMARAQLPSVSISLDSIPFSGFVSEVEESVPVRILYDREWVDSLFVTLEVSNQPLEAVMQKVIEGTDLSFIIRKGAVILSKGYTIKTDYDSDVKEAYASYERFLQSDRPDYKPLEREIEDDASLNPEFMLHRIGNPALQNRGDEAVVSGYITHAENAEPLIGAVVYLEEQNRGAATNAYGFYSIKLPKGQRTLEFRFVGMKTTRRNLRLFSDGILNVEMKEDVVSLKEVTVSTEGQQNVRGLTLGMERISMKQIKDIPMAFGEVDIIRSMVLLPGVQTVGEGASGFNVRGGSTDQNLILLDRAPIMNTSHFVGFFSAINADIMKDATLYKSSIPARYGGRISSVFDLSTREGNKKEISGSGGISPVMGRFMIEGPLGDDNASFLLGARSTYSNWVLGMLRDEKLKRSNVFFMDLNGKLTYDLDDKNSIYASGYYSRDRFDYFSETGYFYSNAAATITWKNVLSSRLFSLYSLVYSRYQYETKDIFNPVSSSVLGYSIGQTKADVEYTWFPSYNLKLRFGANSIWYNMAPGYLEPYGSESLVRAENLELERGLESGAFISAEYDLTPDFTVSGGLRLSSLMVLGPNSVNTYQDPDDRNLEGITGIVDYGTGELIKTYFNPEPRISMRYSIDAETSLKLGYTRMAQYLHMLSNTTAISPTDTWKLSDRYLLPQTGDQIGGGFYRNFMGNSLETSVELYYRWLNNIIDYKGGASLTMNEHLETDVLNGTGKAYGAEVMVKRTRGKLTGWLSYSYSRIFHRIDSPNPEDDVNEGDFFPANYDKPNNLSLVMNYTLSRRVRFSSTVDYSDGRPITVPLASFQYMGGERLQYSNRNGYRLPDYFRWDLSMTLEGNLKVNKLAHSSFTLAFINLTGRKNAYSVFFRTEDGVVNAYRLSVFGQLIPTLTYNFRF
jgi:hypothetical protein